MSPRCSLLSRLILATALVGPFNRLDAQSPTVAGQRLLDLVNADRVDQQLAPLRWDNALAAAALAHARKAARQGLLEHQYPNEPDLLRRAALAGAHLSAVAENLFRGNPSTLTAIEQTWLATPIHRANLLNPQFDLGGIALLRLGNGDLLVVEDLGRSAPAVDLPETERALLHSLHLLGLPEVHPSTAAHALCLEHNQSATASPPATVVQWDGPDPTALPSALTALLHQQTFHQGEIGTCPGQAAAQGFSTTRVTLLLR